MSLLSDILREAGLGRRQVREVLDLEGGDRRIIDEGEREGILERCGVGSRRRVPTKRRLEFDAQPSASAGPQQTVAHPPAPRILLSREAFMELLDTPRVSVTPRLDWVSPEQHEAPRINSIPPGLPPPQEPRRVNSAVPEPQSDAAAGPLHQIAVLAVVYLSTSKPTAFSRRLYTQLVDETQKHLLSGPGDASHISLLAQVHLVASKPTEFSTRLCQRMQELTERFILTEIPFGEKPIDILERVRLLCPRKQNIDAGLVEQISALAREYHIQEFGHAPECYTRQTAPVTLDRAILAMSGINE